MQKEILILGSTGTIGENTLHVIDEYPERFIIKTLIANSNIQRLVEQVRRYLPQYVAVNDQSFYQQLKGLLIDLPDVTVVSGKQAINQLLLNEKYDITIAAIVGMACLEPVLNVIPNTKVLGLANKESIVCAGCILMDFAKYYNTKVIPIDSEHSAIFQILEIDNINKVDRVIITASGGPFLNLTLKEMEKVTPQDAVAHPIWNMGAKISVDSATLMNKGLELIEAHYLFDISRDKLEAIIHPQTLVHGLIEYADGSVLTQIAIPDMRTPISLALSYPERLFISHKKLTFDMLSNIQFFEPDEGKFRCLRLAKEALKDGQSKCIQLNAANEVTVNAFLSKRINFLQIAEIIEHVLYKLPSVRITNIEQVFEEARKTIDVTNSMLHSLK